MLTVAARTEVNVTDTNCIKLVVNVSPCNFPRPVKCCHGSAAFTVTKYTYVFIILTTVARNPVLNWTVCYLSFLSGNKFRKYHALICVSSILYISFGRQIFI
jgi:hypothetical protein